MDRFALVGFVLVGGAAAGVGCGDAPLVAREPVYVVATPAPAPAPEPPSPAPSPPPVASVAPPVVAPCSEEAPDGGAADAGAWLALEGVQIELVPPRCWTVTKQDGWTRFQSPDGNAWLGFVAYQSGAAATKRLAEVANQFDAQDIKWSRVRNEKLGEGQFPSKVADGECRFGDGVEGDISYAAVNPPGKGELLIVYVVRKTKDHRMARGPAIAAIKSMRRRRE